MPEQLNFNPIPPLLSSGNDALIYFTRRDLLDEEVPPLDYVWNLPELRKLIDRQQPDGSWQYSGKRAVVYPSHHYTLLETFKRFRILIEKYEMSNSSPVIQKAVEFLFSCQTEAGDIRGFIANQYATYYTGYILALLIRTGYEKDPRVEKGMRWLLSMRQRDGGWTIPLLTHKFGKNEIYKLTSEYAVPVDPDFTKPFSHNWTDMVLRAFAVHPRYRYFEEAKNAAILLKSSFFKPDNYSSYRAPDYWTRFRFWWPNLLTALESLLLIGFDKNDPKINEALAWFVKHQQGDGLWNISYSAPNETPNDKNYEERLWLTLSICRVLRGYRYITIPI